MSFLANKYRPQSLADLIGQDQTANAIKYAIGRNILGSAILLTGKYGVGKTSIARLIAKCINCTSVESDDACNKCDCCVAISNGSCPDVSEFDAASNTGVDDIATVLESSRYMPSMCKRKAYIIDEAHMLSRSAFNSMLKTLEESETNSLFIMATTEFEKVPATIMSRCIKFVLNDIPEKDIESRINFIAAKESIKIDSEAITLLARKASNSLRNAIVLLEQGLSQTGGACVISRKVIESVAKTISLDDLVAIMTSALEGRIAEAIERLRSVTGFTASNFLAELSQVLYQCALINLRIDCESQENLGDLAAKISIDKIIHLWELVLRSSVEVKAMANPTMSIEILIARMGLKSHQAPNYDGGVKSDTTENKNIRLSNNNHLLEDKLKEDPGQEKQEGESKRDKIYLNKDRKGEISTHEVLRDEKAKISESEGLFNYNEARFNEVAHSNLSFSILDSNVVDFSRNDLFEGDSGGDGLRDHVQEIAKNTKSIPSSFESFAKMFVVNKEAILSYYLNNKMKPVNYSVSHGLGRVEIEKVDIPDKMIRKMEQLAGNWTGIKWEIFITNEGVSESIKTLAEEKIDQYKTKPLVRQILNDFPDSKLDLIS